MKIINLVKLFLPEYLILTIISTLAAGLILKGSHLEVIKLILPIISISAAMVGLNYFNNLMDIELDKINKPKRALVTGEVKPKTAWVICILAFCIALIGSSVISLTSLVLIGAFVLLAIVYSAPQIRLKRFLLSSNIIGSFIYGAIPYLVTLEAVDGRFSLAFLFLFVGLIFGIATVKDFEDVKGDNLKGIKTIPILLGKKTAIKVIFAILMFINLVLLYLELIGILEVKYIYSSILSLFIIIIFRLKILSRVNIQESEIITQSSIMTYSMVTVIIIEIIYGLMALL